MPAKEDKVKVVLATEGGYCINEPTLVTRQNTLDLKIIGQTHSNVVKSRLGFSFTVIISA